MSLQNVCAKALHRLAEETDEAARIRDEMGLVRLCLNENPGYTALLDAAGIPLSEKTGLIDIAFRPIHPYIRNMMKLLTEKRQAKLFPGCADEYLKIYEKASGIVGAKLTAALMPDDEMLKKIKSRLENLSGKSVKMRLEIDPDLIGGMIIEMDGHRFDNSIRTKLRRICTRMSGDMAEE